MAQKIRLVVLVVVARLGDPEMTTSHQHLNLRRCTMVYVYFITNKDRNLVKIGQSTNVEERLKALQAGSPVRLTLHRTVKDPFGTLEYDLHRAFRHLREHGEWFRIDKRLQSVIENPAHYGCPPDRRSRSRRPAEYYLKPVQGNDFKLGFGKHKGDRLSSVIRLDQDYVLWMLWVSWLPYKVKLIVADMVERIRDNYFSE